MLLIVNDIEVVGPIAAVIATGIRSVDDVVRVDHALAACEVRHSRPPGSIEIIAEFLGSPEAKSDEHPAVERPQGAEEA